MLLSHVRAYVWGDYENSAWLSYILLMLCKCHAEGESAESHNRQPRSLIIHIQPSEHSLSFADNMYKLVAHCRSIGPTNLNMYKI